jgi:DNA processing protein
MLFVEGDPTTLSKLLQAVSIVGSRAASSYGLQVTSSLVRELAEVSRVTVSGGALGIDAQVHRSSIESELPTLAVMAGGMDRKYPSANFKLFKQVIGHGALLSEMPPGVAPTRWRFLQRNRLIAALTPTTVVIEAGIRSGSIRTANNALELSRELYAVPGPVLSRTSLGTNALLADNKAQILCDLEQFATGIEREVRSELESALAKRAKDAIRDLEQANLPQIAKNAGLTYSEVGLAITELKRVGAIYENSGSFIIS